MAVYYVFNIGSPPNTEWWAQNLKRGVITAGFEGRRDDRGDVILHTLDEGDWVIAYVNHHGFVGAGLVLGAATYKLHTDLPLGSRSNHKHERGVQWIYAVADVANAVTREDANRQQPRQTMERERDLDKADRIVHLLRERADFRRAQTPMKEALQAAEEFVKANPSPSIDCEHDARIWTLSLVARRRGQPAFRETLLSAYAGCCAITGCAAIDVLEAAHIIHYRGDHTDRVDNGLLLRADIHTLFDLGLIWIDPESLSVQVDVNLHGTEYITYQGQSLRLPLYPNQHPNREHLAWHMKLATEAKGC